MGIVTGTPSLFSSHQTPLGKSIVMPPRATVLDIKLLLRHSIQLSIRLFTSPFARLAATNLIGSNVLTFWALLQK